MAETAKREIGREPVEGWREGSVTQRLGALVEARGLVSGTHLVLRGTSDSCSRGSDALFWPRQALHSCTHVPQKVVEHSFGKLYVTVLSNVFRSNSHPVLPYYRWGS